MKKRFSFVLALVLLIASLWTPSAQAKNISDFTDVKPGAWYFGAVQHAVSNELFCGTSATTFSPNTPMTRGMFITVLGRMHGGGQLMDGSIMTTSTTFTRGIISTLTRCGLGITVSQPAISSIPINPSCGKIWRIISTAISKNSVILW